jgi:nicotinate-nucleotide adenylyltransferase
MPLAVLGGSFDPVHCGHVEMARHILEHDLARDVLVIPAYNSPLKTKTSASAKHRLAMARLAFSDNPNCQVDEREILRGGPSFMIETLEQLHRQYPDRSLRLIMGADNVTDFSLWHRYRDILALVRVLVLGRGDHQDHFSDDSHSSFIAVPGFDQRVSSTEIRAILASGQSAGDLLPAGVAGYIQSSGLYR